MLQQNCRILKFEGLRFYEQDVFYDSYIFTQDIQLTIDVTYVSPGFGIALMDNEGFSIKEKSNTYLFKVGYKEASVYYSDNMETTLVKQITCPDAYTIQEHMKFVFRKQGKKILIYLNDKLIFEEYIKKELDKYNIGYYSNKGNIINNISMAASIPDNWVVNMNNTQGGYIRFLSDKFELEDCRYPAEIEQQQIELKPGSTYYFKAKVEDINDIPNDIKYYIHDFDDDRLFDDEKNKLDSDGKFKVGPSGKVNLKFVGKTGKVSNILLSLNKDDDYIPTTTDILDFNGSQIDIYLQDLKKVTWEGYVSRVPKVDINSDVIYGLILDNSTKIKPEEALGSNYKDKLFNYSFDTEEYMFTVYENSRPIFNQKLTNLSNKITIFKNITAIITELILYKKNGDVINVNAQDENKKYINANINSPIIVVDQYDVPLDLSSSYRLCHYKDHSRYVFTNWEREYFEPEKIINLTKKAINQDDSLVIYGIQKRAKIDFSKFYDVEQDNINSIDMLTREYDYIKESEVLFIDKIQNSIYLHPEQIDKYQMIIVDYLKTNSYCINYHYDKDSYEVNISSLNKNNRMLYNSTVIDISNNITQVNDYKITNISGNVNGYIIIQRGGI